MLANASNNSTISGPTASSDQNTTVKGTAWNIKYTVIIKKELCGNFMIRPHTAVIKMNRVREKIMQAVEMITEKPLDGLRKKK